MQDKNSFSIEGTGMRVDKKLEVSEEQMNEINRQVGQIVRTILDTTGAQYGPFIVGETGTAGRVSASTNGSINIAASSIHSAMEGLKGLPMSLRAQAAVHLVEVVRNSLGGR